MMEYKRIIGAGGDLLPILDAAIYSTCGAVLNGSEPMAENMGELRQKAWERYKRDSAPLNCMLQ